MEFFLFKRGSPFKKPLGLMIGNVLDFESTVNVCEPSPKSSTFILYLEAESLISIILNNLEKVYKTFKLL